MDYKRLYYKLCNYCKVESIHNRIANRNLNDLRLNSEHVYTEVHHILPKHSGGNDEHYNTVRMLPEEHFMAHLIRYKAYNNPKDFYAVRFMLNGFTGKKYVVDIPDKTKNKMFAWFKQHVYEFRKQHSWQTKEGLERISIARKGKMSVKDAKTGLFIGMVETSHPKVLSGDWVHHTKNMISVIDKETGLKKFISLDERNQNKDRYVLNRKDSSGENNNNYSGFSDEDLVNFLIDLSTKVGLGFLLSWSRVINFYRMKYGYKLPHISNKFRFDGRGLTHMYKLAKDKSGLEINPYPRGLVKEQINDQIKKLLQS